MPFSFTLGNMVTVKVDRVLVGRAGSTLNVYFLFCSAEHMELGETLWDWQCEDLYGSSPQ